MRTRKKQFLISQFITTEPTQGRVCFESVQERLAGGKLIHFLGDERVQQPHPLVGWAAHPAPLVVRHAGPEGKQRHDLHELVVLFAQLADFVHQQGKKLPLQMLPKILQSDCQADQIVDPQFYSKESQVFFGFCNWLPNFGFRISGLAGLRQPNTFVSCGEIFCVPVSRFSPMPLF
jgi:hypothetical protein